MHIKWTDGDDTKLSLEAFQEGLPNDIEISINDNDFIHWEVDPKKINMEQRQQIMDIVHRLVQRWIDNQHIGIPAIDTILMCMPSRFFCNAMDEVLGKDWDESDYKLEVEGADDQSNPLTQEDKEHER